MKEEGERERVRRAEAMLLWSHPSTLDHLKWVLDTAGTSSACQTTVTHSPHRRRASMCVYGRGGRSSVRVGRSSVCVYGRGEQCGCVWEGEEQCVCVWKGGAVWVCMEGEEQCVCVWEGGAVCVCMGGGSSVCVYGEGGAVWV